MYFRRPLTNATDADGVYKTSFHIAEDAGCDDAGCWVEENDVPVHRCAGYVVEFGFIDLSFYAHNDHLRRNAAHCHEFQLVSLFLHSKIKWCNCDTITNAHICSSRKIRHGKPYPYQSRKTAIGL